MSHYFWMCYSLMAIFLTVDVKIFSTQWKQYEPLCSLCWYTSIVFISFMSRNGNNGNENNKTNYVVSATYECVRISVELWRDCFDCINFCADYILQISWILTFSAIYLNIFHPREISVKLSFAKLNPREKSGKNIWKIKMRFWWFFMFFTLNNKTNQCSMQLFLFRKSSLMINHALRIFAFCKRNLTRVNF